MSSDKADFANFFDLLVRLAKKENREDFSVQRDLTPLLKKLESSMSDKGATPPTSRRKSQTSGDVPRFPLAEDSDYPFTFKLMIHKLYSMDYWAKTVREAVKESQDQFKPLPEHFKVTPRSPKSQEEFDQAHIRAVKKRCTGRTRAISGPSFVPEPGWISNPNNDVLESPSETRPHRVSLAALPTGEALPTPRYQPLMPLDVNARPLKRAAPIEEEPRPFAKPMKPSKLSNDAVRVGAQNFQVKKRVRSSTFSVAHSGATVGGKKPFIP